MMPVPRGSAYADVFLGRETIMGGLDGLVFLGLYDDKNGHRRG